MTQYYRAVDGVVAELFTPPAGASLATCFTAALAAQFAAVPTGETPQQGWIVNDDGTLSAPVVAPPTQAQLLAYANAKQWELATGGYTITVNSAPLIFPSDVVSMGLITGKAARLAQPNPPASFDWQTPTGFVTIAASDFIAVATQIADFVQSTFNALAVVFAAIEAGTTTTTAEIDAAAWPSNVSITTA